jgi:hypothetical protein
MSARARPRRSRRRRGDDSCFAARSRRRRCPRPPPAPAYIGRSHPLSSAHPLTSATARPSRVLRSYEGNVVHSRRMASTDAERGRRGRVYASRWTGVGVGGSYGAGGVYAVHYCFLVYSLIACNLIRSWRYYIQCGSRLTCAQTSISLQAARGGSPCPRPSLFRYGGKKERSRATPHPPPPAESLLCASASGTTLRSMSVELGKSKTTLAHQSSARRSRIVNRSSPPSLFAPRPTVFCCCFHRGLFLSKCSRVWVLYEHHQHSAVAHSSSTRGIAR